MIVKKIALLSFCFITIVAFSQHKKNCQFHQHEEKRAIENPNYLSDYKGVKILFFTQKKFKSYGFNPAIRKELTFEGYYNKKKLYLTNYPEWVLLKNNYNNNVFLVKDMWNYSIDSIVFKYKRKVSRE